MQAYIISLGFDVWILVKDGYTEPKDGPTTNAEIADYEHNAIAMNAILGGLNESKNFKVMKYASTKEMWDKLATIYQRDTKVQESKL